MAETDPTPGNYEEKTSAKAISAIRKWNSCLLDKSNSDSNTEEDKDYVAVKRQLSVNLSLTLRTRQLLIDSNGGRPVLSLRAPLDLVNFPSMSHPRWPVECEVISDAVHHIEWEPPYPEPFYLSTGLERRPAQTGEERRKVVYCIDDATKRPYFTYSRPGGSRGPIKSATVCNFSQTDTLEFESRFESGNLQKAVRVGICDYELTLRTDLYTTKHTQWFYFRVRNMRAGVSYRFTIVNFMKCSSLYSQGMRPLLYSERAAEIKGIGWQRAGSDISYYRNQDSSSDAPVLYSLTWTLYFPYGSDTCYLAHCYPYTYSRLQRYLRGMSSNPAVMSYCKLRVLCHTLAGNAVYVMTITSRGTARSGSRTKKAVVVTARVHPGETNGSWMMEGLLDFLLGDSDDAQLLRDTFVFKVVPMLNPDGVVVGNYRCSLAGRDLNRNYNTLLRDSFPCVWHTRNMVERVMADTDVVLYCDFHGHNRKNNVFMYGCNSRGDASLHERVFPLMMSKNTSNKFSFKSCKFRVQKSKEGTGRIAMYRLGIRNSYTMEATFAGSTLGDRKGTHFTTGDLKSLGFYLCDTLLDYCDPDPVKTSFCLTELATSLRKHLGTDSKFISDLESSTSGSNSSDSDGLPAHLLNRSQTVHPEAPSVTKKKKRLSRKKRNMLREERAKTTKQGSNKHVESYQRHENTVTATPQEKPAGRHRKKWQLSSPVMKSQIPPATSQHGEISQVTLWQGCEPVKDNYGDSARAAQLHCREPGCPHLSTGTSTLHHTGMDTRQWRCSSQLLHLSALLPPPQSLFHPTERLHLYRRQSVVSYKVVRGRLPSLAVSQRSPSFMFIKMIPDSAPAKRLLASSTTDRPNSRRVYQSRNSLRVSEHYFVPECPSDTCTDVIKTKQYREELQKGVALPFCQPLRDQHQRNIFLKGPDPQHNLFVLRNPNPQGQRLCKGASEDKWRSSVLPRLTKTHGFTKEALPPRHKDAKHFRERP